MNNKILFIMGSVFLVIGVLAIYNSMINPETADILWFSYTALIIIGIGMLTKSSYLIASQINILFIPYIFWNADFFYKIITSKNLFGITNYFFTPRPILSQIITFQHILIIPAALFAIYIIGIKRKDFWKLSLIQITTYFLIIKLISNPQENINCVFRNCLPFQITSVYYPLTWLLSYITMIAITNFFIVKIFRNIQKHS